MSDAEAKVIEQIVDHAGRLHVPLRRFIKDIKTVTVNNPVGFDFTCGQGGTVQLLGSIIDSARFGFDSPDTLIGYLSGCVARRSGFKASFREISKGPSMHIQIGDETCNAHIDSVGISPARDRKGNNILDLSKVVEHWDRDLRPELGPFKHFDIDVLRGPSEITGGPQRGLVISLKRRF